MDAWFRTLASYALAVVLFIASWTVISFSVRKAMDQFLNELSLSEACSKRGMIYYNRKCRSADEVIGDKQ